MELHRNWNDIKSVFNDSFKSSVHFAIATVGQQGEPHVTPIGSLILTNPGYGFYFEKYTRQLPCNLALNNRVCVLAVNSSRWFWLKSLAKGRFGIPPAIRLQGRVKHLRPATDHEISLWQKRVHQLRFTKGHMLMWRNMDMVRDIEFDCIEPVHIGKMTNGLWE